MLKKEKKMKLIRCFNAESEINLNGVTFCVIIFKCHKMWKRTLHERILMHFEKIYTLT